MERVSMMVVLWKATQIGCFGLYNNVDRPAEYPGRWTEADGKRRDEENMRIQVYMWAQSICRMIKLINEV